MTKDPVSLPRDASATEAARHMRDHDTGAILVVGDGDDLAGPVGIVSIGGLALARDRESALADISAAPANN
jgi:CBS domain-containing protein